MLRLKEKLTFRCETEEEAKEICLKQFDNFIEQLLEFRKTL